MSYLPARFQTRYIAGFCVALAAVGIIAFFSFSAESQAYPELYEIQSFRGEQTSFPAVSSYFQNIAIEKGGVYAFEVLKRAQLPGNIDVHLLAHVVGDELYKQEGVDGMSLCTHDFRNACSHTMVIGALLEFGEGALPRIQEACRNAPGGKGAYTMCFHGFGHGVLAYNEYDFPKTVALCEKTGTEAYRDREYVECVGGAVMELLGGGGHDRELWHQRRDEYLSDTNPLSLCQASFMPERVRPMCYTYLTPHLFTFNGGDLGRPGVDEYTKAFSYCDTIPIEKAAERRACFGGLGKEFVVLAQDRDVRNIAGSSTETLEKVYQWCKLAKVEDGISACIIDVVQSLYWGGENDRSGALRFCGVVDDESQKAVCLSELIDAVSMYVDDSAYRAAFCLEVPAQFAPACEAELLHGIDREPR